MEITKRAEPSCGYIGTRDATEDVRQQNSCRAATCLNKKLYSVPRSTCAGRLTNEVGTNSGSLNRELITMACLEGLSTWWVAQKGAWKR